MNKWEYKTLQDTKKDIENKLSNSEKWQPWQLAILETDLDTINKQLNRYKPE